MRLIFTVFLFLISFTNFSFANPLLDNILNDDHYTYDRKLKHPYECGVPPTQLTAPFFKPIDLKTIQQVDFNFQCPTIDEIKKTNPTLLAPLLKTKTFDEIKKMDYRVNLKNINFNSGSYICSYDFGSYNFELIKYMNCDYFSRDFEKLFPSKIVNSYEQMKVPAIFKGNDYQIGNYKFRDFKDLKDMYDDLYKKTLDVVLNLADRMTKNDIYTIDLHSIDSHTDYVKTFPAVLTSLLTFNVDYLQNGKDLIDKLGRININLPTISDANTILQFYDFDITSLLNEGIPTKGKFRDNERLLSYVENKDKYISKTFWGFYYYFFKNIEIGFKQIIEIIFFFGAFSLFGFAIFSKKTNFIGTEIQQKFQFDFTKKFLGIATAFFIFTAPIVSSKNITIDKEFLYNNDEFSSELASSYTPFQGLMKYSINLGNYFGNILADYGTFAYLTYLKYSVNYGIKPETNIIELNTYFKNFYWQIYNVQREYDFVHTFCIASYPTIWNSYQTFPKHINPDKVEIFSISHAKNDNIYEQKMLWDNFHFTQVDYQTCVKMNEKLNYDSIMLVKGITNFTDFFNKHLDSISDPEKMIKQQEEFNNIFKKYITIHNNFGWISTIGLPMFELIVRGKKFYNDLDIDELRNEVKKQSSKYYTFKVNDAYGQRVDSETSFYSYVGMLKGQNGQGGNLNNPNAGDDSSQLNNSDIANAIAQTIAKYGIYSILPKFNELVKNIYNILSDMVDLIKSVLFKAFPALAVSSKVASFLFSGIISLLLLLLAYVIAVFLYNLVILIINIILIAFALLLKVAFYYFEIFLTYLISFALALWSLTTNPQKAWEAWSNFIFQVAKLTFMPILIVLTVFAVIIVNKLVFFLYGVLSYIVSDIAFAANALDNHIGNFDVLENIGQFFSQISVWVAVTSFLGASHLILTILLIVIDLLIIVKFSDWTFEIFGKRDAGGSIGSSIQQFTETIKQKYSGGMV